MLEDLLAMEVTGKKPVLITADEETKDLHDTLVRKNIYEQFDGENTVVVFDAGDTVVQQLDQEQQDKIAYKKVCAQKNSKKNWLWPAVLIILFLAGCVIAFFAIRSGEKDDTQRTQETSENTTATEILTQTEEQTEPNINQENAEQTTEAQHSGESEMQDEDNDAEQGRQNSFGYLTDVQFDISKEGFILVSWEFCSVEPRQVMVRYSNSNKEVHSFTTTQTSVIIKDTVPGETYAVGIEESVGKMVWNSVTIPQAQDYSYNYDSISITKDDIEITMYCNQKKSTRIPVGGQLWLDAYCNVYYGETDTSEVYILYAIKDRDGNIVQYSGEEKTWDTLWDMFHATLLIPEIPNQAGAYVLEVYFNGGFIHSQEFEIING